MPIYSYACRLCGEFTELRTMSRAGEPARCPSCGTDAARVIRSVHVGRLSPALRLAHERNEKSAHEPRLMSRHSWEHEGRRRAGRSYLRGHHHHH